MRCTSKQRLKRLLCLTCIAAVFMTGCGTKIENAYDTYSTDYINGYNGSNYFASNLCVTNDVNFGQDNMQFAKTAEGAGAFNIDTHQVLYSQNLFEKLYPASTTKILTAYIILKNCDLNATVTVSHDAANPGHSSSVCGLKEGDAVARGCRLDFIFSNGRPCPLFREGEGRSDTEHDGENDNDEAARMDPEHRQAVSTRSATRIPSIAADMMPPA